MSGKQAASFFLLYTSLSDPAVVLANQTFLRRQHTCRALVLRALLPSDFTSFCNDYLGFTCTVSLFMCSHAAKRGSPKRGSELPTPRAVSNPFFLFGLSRSSQSPPGVLRQFISVEILPVGIRLYWRPCFVCKNESGNQHATEEDERF